MSSTTQILFNSPALHSLKRDQLVKLCKIHAIKASGKNVDLIEKLKRHAETLPKDDPLSIAVRGETNEHDDDSNDNEPKNEDHESGGEESSPCPSPDNKQLRPGLNTRLSDWEVVMYSIAEEDESAAAQGTVGSSRSTRSGNKGVAGEFGTGSSSKLGSSIKSLASSLGKLKKGHGSRSPKSTVSATVTFEKSETAMETAEDTTDELEQTSQPYSTLPPTQAPVVDVPLEFNPSRMSMDGFLADGEAPLPGHALRPGGAPSTPSQPTTTIRLVNRAKDRTSTSNRFGGGVSDTPRLEPFKTSFDLIMGSPTPAGSLYPTLTLNDLPPSLTSLQKPSSTSPPLSQMDGVIEAPRPAARSLARSPDPFVFGSPLPQHRVSDVQFKSAAASVLEEMNKRLKEDGVDGVDTSLIGRLHPGVSGSKGDVSPREVKPMPRARGGEVKEKFNQAHQGEFQKMEGIDSFVKRRAAVQQPQEEGGKSVLIGKKRKSSVVAIAEGARRPGGARASGTRVVSKRAKKTIPGAFGGDDDDDDDAADQHPEERAGKRIRIISDAKDEKAEANAAEAEAARVEDEDREEKQRMAIKRKLDMNKAKRRSSTGPGMHGRRSGRLSGRPSIAVQPKPKPSRFAFLSSAKSLVQSVWGRGKAPQAAATTSNAIPKAPTKPSTLLKKSAPPTTAPAHGATLKPDSKSTESNVTRPTAASSARSRSPIPSFPAHSVRSSLASNGGTQTSKASGNPSLARKASVIGSTTNSRMSSAHVSSIGTRLSSARSSAAGSMGVKKLSAQLPNAPTAKPSATGSSSSRMSAASRLFAPTASSLAKMSRNASATSKALSEQQNATPSSSIPVRSPPPSSKPNSALGVITNTTPAPPNTNTNTTTSTNTTNNLKSPTPFSPRTKGKIFSQPVHAFTPVRSPSATAGPSMSFGVLSPGGARGEDAKSPPAGRQRSLNGRKPRISRSKVIARLASQRERAAGPASASNSASNSGAGSGSNSGARVVSGAGASTPRAGKARSSLGAKVARSSLGGAKVRVSSGGSGAGVLLSAKKRARQSEYYRRRSRVEGSSPVKGPGGMGMDVDV
ncbi:hypothetical protein DFP72DRAFT_1138141 [Ephemerocybe angulata]|uniref:SAP domain-containing protein n=1 Tax=Ephemerocybe angulata TaxID=980116 RepID=A0A8H6HRI8_9AGAR|nr:hypothetical protein DFP72DRAFT_1138141 [Tulosesus angulatus]